MTRAVVSGRFRGKPVVVLYGGETSERDVSLRTGEAIAAALTSKGHEVSRFDWSQSRLGELAGGGFAAAFIALHGGCGENGELQGALEIMGLPYTGSGVLASALAMDKARTKALAAGAGFPTAPWHVWTRAEARRALERGPVTAPLPAPFVVKPTADGSSVGVTIVRDGAEVEVAVQRALAARGDVMFERFVQGREVTVAVADGVALGVCEVVPNGQFYDYAAKYERMDTVYRVPSSLSEAQEDEVEALAARFCALLGCRGVARVDFLVDERGPWLLEVNTIPGMTASSLVPKIAAGQGIDFATLADWLLDLATLDGLAG